MRKGRIFLKFIKPSIVLAASLILNLSMASLSLGAPKTQFSLVYTNDVLGEVEPCG